MSIETTHALATVIKAIEALEAENKAAYTAGREAMREEAAKMCDRMQEIPATEARHCAEDIRSLK